jgi:putative transposase
MARKQRYHIPGAFYHVMLRGNDGQAIFSDDNERCRICLLIQEGVERYGHRIHAFCLMGNHIHLLIQVGAISLSKIIHNLTFRYSQFFNGRYQKVGHLFQGRFKAILIQEKTYFLRLLRYIHMNPVRAHLVQEPEDYPWSGHSAYLGQMEFVWLTTEYGLKKFADRLDEGRLQYRNYVLKCESEEGLMELRKGFCDGQILGEDYFIEDVRNSLKEASTLEIPLPVILKTICQVYDVDEKALASPQSTYHLSLARGAATAFARKQGRSLVEMAKIFKRDESSLSRSMKRFSEKCVANKEIQIQYQLFEELVMNFATMHA